MSELLAWNVLGQVAGYELAKTARSAIPLYYGAKKMYSMFQTKKRKLDLIRDTKVAMAAMKYENKWRRQGKSIQVRGRYKKRRLSRKRTARKRTKYKKHGVAKRQNMTYGKLNKILQKELPHPNQFKNRGLGSGFPDVKRVRHTSTACVKWTDGGTNHAQAGFITINLNNLQRPYVWDASVDASLGADRQPNGHHLNMTIYKRYVITHATVFIRFRQWYDYTDVNKSPLRVWCTTSNDQDPTVNYGEVVRRKIKTVLIQNSNGTSTRVAEPGMYKKFKIHSLSAYADTEGKTFQERNEAVITAGPNTNVSATFRAAKTNGQDTEINDIVEFEITVVQDAVYYDLEPAVIDDSDDSAA